MREIGEFWEEISIIYGLENFIKTLFICELDKFSDKSPKGCMLEVGLQYPEDLCDSHSKYHVASENIQIKILRHWSIGQ